MQCNKLFYVGHCMNTFPFGKTYSFLTVINARVLPHSIFDT